MSNRDDRYEIHIGDSAEPQPIERAADGTFRIALVADFSGRGGRGAASMALGRIMRVDRDEIDAAVGAMAPSVTVRIEPDAAPLVISFAELEDFHPDRLVERVPVFQSLLATGRSAGTGGSAAPSPRPAAPRAAESARAMTEGSLLDMMLDSTPATSSAATGPRDELSDFVRQAVRPHAVHDTGAASVTAKVDAVIEALMRVVLHDPRFQALEARWRAVDLLARRLDTDAELQLWLVDAPNLEALGALTGDWSLIVADFFGGAEDVEQLARIASLGRRIGAPVLMGGAPSLAGTSSFARTPDPDDWSSEAPTAWDALRRSADAPYLGVALPRVLLRLPYGKKADECSTVRFEELDGGEAAPHESYLWGNGAFACALIALAGIADDGDVATHGVLDGLPLPMERVDGEVRAIPCAEAVLGSRAIDVLLERGLSPLQSMRDADVVRAPRIQSIAQPPRPLVIRAAGDR